MDFKAITREAKTRAFLASILEAMDECEEIGGPEGMDYVAVMRAVQHEAQKRADAAVSAALNGGR